MATGLRFPNSFSFMAPNSALEWEQWRRQFDCLAEVGVLLSLLGRKRIKIYETLTLAVAGAKKIKPVLNAFTAYFQRLKSEVFERFLFHLRHQQPGEPFDTWLAELRSMVKPCKYGTNQVREKLI